jgi:hypothetical protein
MTRSAIILRSLANYDLHLSLSNEYALALISRLKSEGIAFHDFQESNDGWKNFKDLCLSGICREDLVLFYTHGEITPLCDGCDEETNTPAECSCSHGVLPCVTVMSADLLQGSMVFGITACYLAIRFGPKCISAGALSFLGFADKYWHTALQMPDNLPNPFEEVATSSAIQLINGSPLEKVHEEYCNITDRWLQTNWPVGKAPKDWWLARIALRNNKDTLRYLSNA